MTQAYRNHISNAPFPPQKKFALELGQKKKIPFFKELVLPQFDSENNVFGQGFLSF